MTTSLKSTPRSSRSRRTRLALSSVPVTPTNFARRPRLAHVASAVATWPPHDTKCCEIRIFASEAVGEGYAGSWYTKSTDVAPMPRTSNGRSTAGGGGCMARVYPLTVQGALTDASECSELTLQGALD